MAILSLCKKWRKAASEALETVLIDGKLQLERTIRQIKKSPIQVNSIAPVPLIQLS